MGYYVIRRDDGAFVSQPGSEHSYTKNLLNARLFRTKAEAEANLCPGNERVVRVADLFERR